MKKIPLIFLFDHDIRKMTMTPNPACQWVFDGEGIATRKYNGTACLVKDGVLYKRRAVKLGKRTPSYFMLIQSDIITGKQFGWVPVTDSKEDRYHMEAWRPGMANGTYELLGPKIQGNPENCSEHILMKHSDAEQYILAPWTYHGLNYWLNTKDIEGLVFHHLDGRMAKIRKKDFGLSRKPIDIQS